MRISKLPISDRLRRRIERQYMIARAFNRRRALKTIVNRTGQIRKGDVLAGVDEDEKKGSVDDEEKPV